MVEKRQPGKICLFSIAVILAVFTPTASYANAGIPMLFIVWPLSWLAFVPIVIIETIVARKAVQLSWKRSAVAVLISNCASTVIGIPLTWLLLVPIGFVSHLASMPLGWVLSHLVTSMTMVDELWSTIIMPSWLIPYEEDLYWMIPAATALLQVYFWIASVFIEKPIFRHFAKCDESLAKKWSWQANTITYGLIVSAAMVWLVVEIAKPPA